MAELLTDVKTSSQTESDACPPKDEPAATNSGGPAVGNISVDCQSVNEKKPAAAVPTTISKSGVVYNIHLEGAHHFTLHFN